MSKIRFKLAPWQAAAIYTPITHMGMMAGIASGKTYTGAHFCIDKFINQPGKTGIIGANTYDQLSQATLRELFYWLDHYRIEYVQDRIPPPEWGAKREFKSYKNILTVRHDGKISHAFTRVMGSANPLRGIEASWYWLDETRDTPENTHDVVLSRMRETPGYIKGLVTTTTNGEDWGYKRFVLGSDNKLFGCMHVETYQAVKFGIITEDFYQALLKAYSPLMAEQELFARHVNVLGGRAYYACTQKNKARVAPWGDSVPSRDRPLIVGCDFNFQPAPHIWMIGQVGPAIYGPRGEFWADHIHWFGEISQSEASSRSMTISLMARYPDFFYRIFGDATGNRGTTSNAGETDYNQIGNELADAGYTYTIDVDQANPIVRDRVENMNAMYSNALGEVRQTYNPDMCPMLDADNRIVGWKKESGNKGRGRLDNAGDLDRTHASDGAGYAVWKLFPPQRRGTIGRNVESPLVAELGSQR